ncbi:YwiC-like family protein [Brevibacillus marinus]|uniref:YwiC-like family protein n=1 Tax=Brevibacillus marinus TaxID=2496837 RepID=UPI000F82023E|nr:YwiC-like family protein [Brevibacillus marinus]
MSRGFLPRQHGAWAMLLIPFLFGMFAAKPVWQHALLFLGWLLAYLFVYAFLQWVRTGQIRLYGRPLLLYGALLMPTGAALLWLEPGLWPLVPLFIPLFLVNCYYARRNRERSLLNDLAAVVQFSLIVFAAYELGGGSDWRLAAALFAFSVLYFTGSVFYVKTMIREKHNVKYYWVSVGYHLALLALAAICYPPGLLLPLAVLLVRAIWSPRAKLTVKQSGMLEIAYSLLITCSVLLVYAV